MTKKLIRANYPKLYKYYSPDKVKYLHDILFKSELYFSSPSQLNDPSEGKLKFADMSEDDLKEFFYNYHIENNKSLTDKERLTIKNKIDLVMKQFGKEALLRKCHETLTGRLDKNKITSFSKRWDNMMLWAKYADNHKGFCLEFKNDGIFSLACEVDYEETTINFCNTDKIGIDFFFQKKPEWTGEEEVRIVLPTQIQSPYKFEPALLCKIILGEKMDIKDRENIFELVAKRTVPIVVEEARYSTYDKKLILNRLN